MGEVAESITLIRKALKLLQQDDSQLHCGELAYKTLTGSWGISESARGSNLHWLMLDADGCIEDYLSVQLPILTGRRLP